MHWIPLIAWLAALVVAAVVLGFCAYELRWKANRLQRDLENLHAANADLESIRQTVALTQQRIAAATAR